MISPEDLGARLRVLRRTRRLSLREIEVSTRGEFKASALGAYERGQRAITIQRLSRLLAVYGVEPLDVLSEDSTIDLVALERDEAVIDPSPDEALLVNLNSFISWVRSERRDPATGPLRFRRADANLIGALFGVPAEAVHQLARDLETGANANPPLQSLDLS